MNIYMNEIYLYSSLGLDLDAGSSCRELWSFQQERCCPKLTKKVICMDYFYGKRKHLIHKNRIKIHKNSP